MATNFIQSDIFIQMVLQMTQCRSDPRQTAGTRMGGSGVPPGELPHHPQKMNLCHESVTVFPVPQFILDTFHQTHDGIKAFGIQAQMRGGLPFPRHFGSREKRA
jgi:hypothetical protein